MLGWGFERSSLYLTHQQDTDSSANTGDADNVTAGLFWGVVILLIVIGIALAVVIFALSKRQARKVDIQAYETETEWVGLASLLFFCGLSDLYQYLYQ